MRTFIIMVLSVFFFGYSSVANASPDGKTSYEKCRICHAVDGTGTPSVAKLLKIDQTLLDLTVEKNRKKSDSEITKVVREGQGKMKSIPMDKISDEELKAAICYIRELQKTKK